MPDSAAQIPFACHQLGIVGVGLIGGSLAAGLKKRGFRGSIQGIGRNAERLEQARDAGLIDSVSTDIAHAATECELLVFCTPVDHIIAGVKAAAASGAGGLLMTDAGSAKARICRELQGQLPHGQTFIGSHPLAGSEKQGFEHADADLYQDRVCVLTPVEDSPGDELSRLQQFWESLGMQVLEMSPEDHDRGLARTSHLPHVVASALAAQLTDRNRSLAATGFRDTTRIAGGDPDLWVAILLDNADEVLSSVDEFRTTMVEFRQALENRDAARLKKLLEVAKTRRDQLE